MIINRKEIEKFFEEARELRNLAIGGKTESSKEETRNNPLNPKYIGVYLSNYYSRNINDKFHNDLLR